MHFINHVQRLSSFPLCPEIIKKIIKVESQESEESLVRQKKSEGVKHKSKISKDSTKTSLSICGSLGVTQ